MNQSHTHPHLNPKNEPPVGPVAAVNRRFMKLLDEKGPLTKIWGVIALFNLGIAVLSSAIQIRTDAPMLHELLTDPNVMHQYGPDRPVEANFAALLLYPLIFIAMGLYFGSFNVIKSIDAGQKLSFADARSMMLERFLPTTVTCVLFVLATTFGTMCCIIPGLVAGFLFYLAPYLVAAEGDSPIDALRRSTVLTRRHALLVCLLLAIGLVLGIGTMVIQVASMAVFQGMLGTTGILIGGIATWGLGTIVGYFAWLYYGSIFVTVAQH